MNSFRNAAASTPAFVLMALAGLVMASDLTFVDPEQVHEQHYQTDATYWAEPFDGQSAFAPRLPDRWDVEHVSDELRDKYPGLEDGTYDFREGDKVSLTMADRAYSARRQAAAMERLADAAEQRHALLVARNERLDELREAVEGIEVEVTMDGGAIELDLDVLADVLEDFAKQLRQQAVLE